jgi:hypothetical protein
MRDASAAPLRTTNPALALAHPLITIELEIL